MADERPEENKRISLETYSLSLQAEFDVEGQLLLTMKGVTKTFVDRRS
jgi:hypothetical protein